MEYAPSLLLSLAALSSLVIGAIETPFHCSTCMSDTCTMLSCRPGHELDASLLSAAIRQAAESAQSTDSEHVQVGALQQLAPMCACIHRVLAQRTHNAELGVLYGSRFMELLAATELAVQFMAGREPPFRVPRFKLAKAMACCHAYAAEGGLTV